MSDAPPWSEQAGGRILIRIRLTPKSSHDRVDGMVETSAGLAIQARVRAVPEDGAANAALIKLLADWLDLPRSSVELTAGGKSRIKTLSVTTDDMARVRDRLQTWATAEKE